MINFPARFFQELEYRCQGISEERKKQEYLDFVKSFRDAGMSTFMTTAEIDGETHNFAFNETRYTQFAFLHANRTRRGIPMDWHNEEDELVTITTAVYEQLENDMCDKGQYFFAAVSAEKRAIKNGDLSLSILTPLGIKARETNQ